MAAEAPTITQADAEATGGEEYVSRGGDLFEEADVYGDWGAEAGFEERRLTDFVELQQANVEADWREHLAPRAFQLLHQEATSDVRIAKADVGELPGCASLKNVYIPSRVDTSSSNKARFAKAFNWSVKNLWNMNMDGEICIGAGKALYFRGVAKHNRNVPPLWTCQQQLMQYHPYAWFAVSHDSAVDTVDKMVDAFGMKPSQTAETSYKVEVKRTRDSLDIELNSQLQCTLANKQWDRFLVSHLLRTNMPDIRFFVRARVPLRKKIAESYTGTEILKMTDDSVQSMLPPELGEVVYAAERVIRRWSTKTKGGVTLQLVETKRTPMIVTREGEEGERMEYELIASIPQASERPNVQLLSDELWTNAELLATLLEESSQEFQAHTMPASAAFGEH
jgi:hypothetical protein